MRKPGALLAAALALCAASLRADTALRQAFERQMLAQAQALSCAAQVWAPALDRYGADWTLTGEASLPPPGPWSDLMVPLALAGSTTTAAAKVQVRILPCVAGWTVTRPLSLGMALDDSVLAPKLFDPRGLSGPAFTGRVPAGALSARALAPGQALLLADFADPGALKAGERVTLLVRVGDIEAGDEGVLLDGGGDGCLLRAQHLRSGKVVRGRLKGRVLTVED